MSQAKVLMTVRGGYLKRASFADGMELALFRNNGEDFDIFDIQILLQGRIFTLEQHYCDKETAFKEYKKLLGEPKISKKGGKGKKIPNIF